MQTTYRSEYNFLQKKRSFKQSIKKQPFLILLKPEKTIFEDNFEIQAFLNNIQYLVNLGIRNIEIAWQDNQYWSDLIIVIQNKFPFLKLGSASIKNRKSIDESIKLGLDFSMMKFWDKNLYNYAKKKNYLLIPGLNNITELNEAIFFNCEIIKIYPVSNLDKFININEYHEKLSFIAAGGLSITDLFNYQEDGYEAIVIGNKGFNGKNIDENIIYWLESNANINKSFIKQ